MTAPQLGITKLASKVTINGIEIARFAEDYGYPNAFRRFWYWALLGWKWERL